MTDNEIINLLDCCKHNHSPATYTYSAIQKAIDLINRQKAEIERVEKELMKCKLEKELLHQTINQIKSEAIKEFAERLKDSADKTRIRNLGPEKIIFYTDELKLDKLVNEMTEVNENDGA